MLLEIQKDTDLNRNQTYRVDDRNQYPLLELVFLLEYYVKVRG